jgi:hypothetical protein
MAQKSLQNKEKEGKGPRCTDQVELTMIRLQGSYSPDVHFSVSPDDGEKQLMLAKVER